MGSYTTLESGFKTMWFPCPDSLVSCEQKADPCKKNTVSKISGFVWTWPKSAHSTGQYAL